MSDLIYVDECDFSKERSQLFDIQGGVAQRNFAKRHVEASLVSEKEEVYSYISKFIEERPYINSIAFSDGATLYQLELFNWVRKTYPDKDINQPLQRSRTGHYAVYGENPPGPTNFPFEEWKERTDKWQENCRRSLTADLLIISANAITMKGEVVSIDGLGNRVSGMLFGPKHVICIVGRNKIYPDSDTALTMIHHRVVPLTYLRHINKHHASFQDVPCVKLGQCVNCMHEYSSCRDVVVMRGQIKQHKDRFHLLMVNQDLGF